MGSNRFRRALRIAASAAFTLPFLLPFYLAVVASLAPAGAPPPTRLQWLPAGLHLESYRLVFALIPVGRYLLNSLLLIAAGAPLTLALTSTAGFSLSQSPPGIRRRLLKANLVLLIIPAASLWLFRFQILRWVGLADSLWALLLSLTASASPLFVLLYFWSFRRIPREVFAAARLQGASPLQALWYIGLPLVKPTSLAVGLFTAILFWSDFVNPVLYLHNPARYPLAVGLQILNQMDPTNIPVRMAGAVLMALPILGLFLLLQRVFLQGDALADLFSKNE
jgi:multiple sugar transport system permease protein